MVIERFPVAIATASATALRAQAPSLLTDKNVREPDRKSPGRPSEK
jgi:hypothetical protein